MDRLVLGFLEPVLGDVLLGEISKGTVWVFGSVIIFPWLVGLVVLFGKDSFELILTYMSQRLHWIWEARLSLLRLLAMELCCNLGSIFNKL